MKEMRSLSLEDMEKISGGNSKTVVTYTVVRSGAGDNYAKVGEVYSGQSVFFTGEIAYNDSESTTWYRIASPAGWVKRDVLN